VGIDEGKTEQEEKQTLELMESSNSSADKLPTKGWYHVWPPTTVDGGNRRKILKARNARDKERRNNEP
jgi:hypothetical protein